MDWSDWLPLDERAIRQKVPKGPGVYRVRNATGPFGRLRGSSDIIYIGKTDRNLRSRLLMLVGKGGPHVAAPRIARLRQAGYKLEFCYLQCVNPQEVEDNLLKEYEAEHLELPPLNHGGGLGPQPRR